MKDFKWHKTTASPNWHVIPEGERFQAHAVSESAVSVAGKESTTELTARQKALERSPGKAETNEESLKSLEESEEEL